MDSFNFKSLTRQGVAYQIARDHYRAGETGFFHNPPRYLSPEINEYLIYDDGMVQHSPARSVSVESIGDALASLAVYLRDNPDTIEIVAHNWRPNWNKPGRATIDFFSGLKYNPDKKAYYSTSDLKRSTAPGKANDRRWEEIPNWADGKFISIFRFLIEGKSHYGAIERYALWLDIRQEMEYPYISDKETIDWLGFIPDVHVSRAFDAVQAFVDSHQQAKNARLQVDCLLENLKLKKKEE